jgi:hypothetical protein
VSEISGFPLMLDKPLPRAEIVWVSQAFFFEWQIVGFLSTKRMNSQLLENQPGRHASTIVAMYLR